MTSPRSFVSGRIFTTTVIREPSGRSMSTSASDASESVPATTSAIGHCSCGMNVPSGRNNLNEPQNRLSVSPSERLAAPQLHRATIEFLNDSSGIAGIDGHRPQIEQRPIALFIPTHTVGCLIVFRHFFLHPDLFASEVIHFQDVRRLVARVRERSRNPTLVEGNREGYPSMRLQTVGNRTVRTDPQFAPHSAVKTAGTAFTGVKGEPRSSPQRPVRMPYSITPLFEPAAA